MKRLTKDITAGFSVFLLALPLCLGIAIASNFPPVAGILSAIVGGLIAPFFGGAKLSIKGPAAGLIVIVFNAVHHLGAGDLILGYERTLAIGIVAAVIQIILGLAKKANIAEVMPPSVIHGMLAAIGVVILSQQSYIMMGVYASSPTPLTSLIKIPSALIHANPIIFAIGLLALTVVIVWPMIKKTAFIPSTIILLLLVIPLSLYFDLNTSHSYNFMGNTYPLGPSLLIHLPENILSVLHFPDFSVISSPTSLKYIIMFVLVGSIESLLTVCAIDSLSRGTTSSDLNRDLQVVGMGNLISACIGGLPMISEIVRSKANMDYGAQSAWSNFFHGLFLLLALLLFSNIINLIPLSALAALLVFVGFKLASPKEFIHVYKTGKDQFFLFLSTFFVTLFTDLLIGVATGVLLKLMLHLVRGNSLHQLFKLKIVTHKLKNSIVINIEGPLTFLNYLRLKKMILHLKNETAHIVINLNTVTLLDHTVLKKLETLKDEFRDTDIRIESSHPQQLSS